jgi:SAM-dependent methyltransferase
MPAVTDLPEHAARNRVHWDQWARDYVDAGHENWATDEPSWGIFGVPEADVGFLPDGLESLDAIELGCGTGYVSAWLARRGARPVGVDNSAEQLATCRRFQQEFGLEFPLHHGNAEDLPYADDSFDVAVSEYGASIWCDPYAWIPEAARVLRPGGRLVFLVNHPLMVLCAPDAEGEPATERLLRPYFGLHRVEWPEDDSVEFHLPHGKLIDLLREQGFAIDGLVELRPPADATTSYDFVTLDWARRWPCEEVWKARLET